MGSCQNCGKEIFLAEGESKCPNCGGEQEYHCQNCANNFEVKDTKQCSWCGFYFCPECNCCSE